MRFAYPPYGPESGLLFHSKKRRHSIDAGVTGSLNLGLISKSKHKSTRFMLSSVRGKASLADYKYYSLYFLGLSSPLPSFRQGLPKSSRHGWQ